MSALGAPEEKGPFYVMVIENSCSDTIMVKVDERYIKCGEDLPIFNYHGRKAMYKWYKRESGLASFVTHCFVMSFGKSPLPTSLTLFGITGTITKLGIGMHVLTKNCESVWVGHCDIDICSVDEITDYPTYHAVAHGEIPKGKRKATTQYDKDTVGDAE